MKRLHLGFVLSAWSIFGQSFVAGPPTRGVVATPGTGEARLLKGGLGWYWIEAEAPGAGVANLRMLASVGLQGIATNDRGGVVHVSFEAGQSEPKTIQGSAPWPAAAVISSAGTVVGLYHSASKTVSLAERSEGAWRVTQTILLSSAEAVQLLDIANDGTILAAAREGGTWDLLTIQDGGYSRIWNSEDEIEARFGKGGSQVVAGRGREGALTLLDRSSGAAAPRLLKKVGARIVSLRMLRDGRAVVATSQGVEIVDPGDPDRGTRIACRCDVDGLLDVEGGNQYGLGFDEHGGYWLLDLSARDEPRVLLAATPATEATRRGKQGPGRHAEGCEVGPAGGLQILGLASQLRGDEQVDLRVQIAGALDRATVGELRVRFEPAAGLALPGPLPPPYFANSQTTLRFEIPAGQTEAIFPEFSREPGLARLRLGPPMAGTIIVSVTSDGVAGTCIESKIAESAPRVEVTRLQVDATGLSFAIDTVVSSNTRSVASAVYTFATNLGLDVRLTANLAPQADNWFSSSASAQYGGLFWLQQRFQLTGGTVAFLRSVGVSVSNREGASPTQTVPLLAP